MNRTHNLKNIPEHTIEISLWCCVYVPKLVHTNFAIKLVPKANYNYK